MQLDATLHVERSNSADQLLDAMQGLYALMPVSRLLNCQRQQAMVHKRATARCSWTEAHQLAGMPLQALLLQHEACTSPCSVPLNRQVAEQRTSQRLHGTCLAAENSLNTASNTMQAEQVHCLPYHTNLKFQLCL